MVLCNSNYDLNLLWIISPIKTKEENLPSYFKIFNLCYFFIEYLNSFIIFISYYTCILLLFNGKINNLIRGNFSNLNNIKKIWKDLRF